MATRTCKCGGTMTLWQTIAKDDDGNELQWAAWHCLECYAEDREGADEAFKAAIEARARVLAERAREREEVMAAHKEKQRTCPHEHRAHGNPKGWRCYSQDWCTDCGKLLAVHDSSD
jgi:hypothetical protein